MAKAQIGIGDEVFLVGLYAPNSGGRRNIASGRFGSLSMLASSDHPHGYKPYPARPRFIADMRSRPGYSGSPVFVYRTVFVDLRNFREANYVVDFGQIGVEDYTTLLMLLGVHAAQFNDEVSVSLKSPTIPGALLAVPGALSIVVPAWRISALLNRPRLAEIQAKRDALQIEASRAK